MYQNDEQDCAWCGGPGSSCGSGLTDLYSASTGIGCRFRSSWDSTPSVRLSPATLVLTPGPTGLTCISQQPDRRQPKVGTDQATKIQPKRNDVVDNENIILSLSDKIFRVLNLRKTSIIYTLSSFEETSDISKLEQFHISDIYLDCKGVKQERFFKVHKSREDRLENEFESPVCVMVLFEEKN